jgi:hypothetical protein
MNYQSFKEFYPFYLQQHQNSVCRTLHFFGIFAGAVFFFLVLFTFNNKGWLILSLFWGYAFGWIGHFFFEKNKPATLKYPFYSFIGDFVMFKDMLIGKVKFKNIN